ncbi:MAG: hypothetical protein F4X94_04845 [Dehalococcoidia bacterium]|nr:hypothetical protein [Dehalococcoidia bacterium]
MTSTSSNESLTGTKHHIRIGDRDVPVLITPSEGGRPERTLAMTSEEMAWLEEYCKGLRERFADDVEQVIVYGFRAKGIVHEDLSLNTLVVISEGNGVTADEVSAIGYRLDMSKYSVAPSITALTSSQWDRIKRENNPFYWSAMNEGVSII